MSGAGRTGRRSADRPPLEASRAPEAACPLCTQLSGTGLLPPHGPLGCSCAGGCRCRVEWLDPGERRVCPVDRQPVKRARRQAVYCRDRCRSVWYERRHPRRLLSPSAVVLQERTNGAGGTQREIILAVLSAHPAGLTSAELAELHGGLDRYQVARRLPELWAGGEVERGERRECRVGGKGCWTWRAAENTQSH